MTLPFLPTPTEMIVYLDRFVFGQPEAKRALATSVYNHYLGLAYRGDHPEVLHPFGQNHILLLGPTGVGKSYLVMKLARYLGVPFAFGNAKSLVEVGFVGQQVDSLLRSLLLAANNDIRLAQRGIIFIDEIDKIRKKVMSERDVSGEGVQTSLLALFDGRPIPVRISNEQTREIDTSDILFIGAGAFSDLADIVRRRARGAKAVGFNAAIAGGQTLDDDVALHSVLPEDLQEFGFIIELIGRFSVIVALNHLGADDMVQLLTDSEESILKQQQLLFSVHDIRLEFTRDALRAVAERSVEAGTGVRGLERVVLATLDEVRSRLPELAAAGIRAVEITDEAVRDGAEPLFERGPSSGEHRPMPADSLRRRALDLAMYDPESGTSSGGHVLGISDTSGWSTEDVRNRLASVLDRIAWDQAAVGAREWWQLFDRANEQRPAVVLRLAEELRNRKASLNEFYLTFCRSGTNNIQANLHFLDYIRLKRQEQQRKLEQQGLSEASSKPGNGLPDFDGGLVDLPPGQ